MDSATQAAASDPASNWHFRRRWADPPPLKRESRPCRGAALEKPDDITNASDNIRADLAAQRAIAAAARHAERLATRATTLAAIGQRDAALRTARLAERLAQVAR
jgi:hypothetical protein